ncbi:MAG: C45 family autoproteolytic acyltransferase/hydrolase [Promethearchaeota archaeon]
MDKKKITNLIIITILILSGTLSLLFYVKSRYTNLSVVVIEGDDFYDLGKDYGQKCKREIQGVVSLLRELKDAEDIFGTSFKKLQDTFEPYIPDYLIEEMEGVADGARVEYGDILLINFMAEIMMLASYGDIREIACTQFAKVKKVGTDTGPILGRTLDFFPSFLLQDFQVFLVADINGTKWIGHTIAGMVGFLTGMNDQGLVVSVSLVNTEETGEGLPIVLSIRHTLQTCKNVTEAESFLTRNTTIHSIGWNYMLMDKSGNAAVVEVTNKRKNTRWIGEDDEHNNYIAATNDFHSKKMEQYCHPSTTSKVRKARAEELMAAKNEFNLGDAIDITRDTYDPKLGATNPGRNTICRKWIRKTFLPGGTLGAFIALPEQEYVVACNGYPDSALFYAINFDGEVVGPIA